MISHLLGLPDTPLVTFLTLAGGGLFVFFLLGSLSYLFFFVWRRDEFHPEYKADRKSVQKSMKWSAISLLGNAILVAPFHWLLAHGYGSIYWDVSEHSVAWLGGAAVIMVVWSETAIYWIHRALHGNFLYHKLHHIHHQWRESTPWVGVAFHPLDAFMQGLPHHIFAFIFPVHAGVYLVSVGLVSVWAVSIHDRVSFVRWPFLNNTGHHTLHHWYCDYNYGQYTTFWDRLCGTWKSPFEGCEDVPEGVLAEAGWAVREEAPEPEAQQAA